MTDRPREARRIVVTGGAGFIGASLVRALLDRGDEVVVVDAGVQAGFVYLEGTRARIVTGDARDGSALATALDGASAVVHLAAQTSVPASVQDPLHDLEQNVGSTLRLLEAARAASIGRVVLASSTAVLGALDRPAAEDVVPRPMSPYGASKLAAEAYLLAYHATHGLATTALRIANVYGPYSLHKSSVVSAFLRAGLRGEVLTVFGDGTQTRDFVHVDDVVALMLATLDAPAGSVSGEVFQVGSGTETSINDLVEEMARALGDRPLVRHAPVRPGELRRSASDIRKATRVLGYAPRVTLPEGLAGTLRWFREAMADPHFAPLAERPTSGSE